MMVICTEWDKNEQWIRFSWWLTAPWLLNTHVYCIWSGYGTAQDSFQPDTVLLLKEVLSVFQSSNTKFPSISLSFSLCLFFHLCLSFSFSYFSSDYIIKEKSVLLQKKENEGFGFVLRGAKGDVLVHAQTNIHTRTEYFTHYFFYINLFFSFFFTLDLFSHTLLSINLTEN